MSKEYRLVSCPENYPGKSYASHGNCRVIYEHRLVWWQHTGHVVEDLECIKHKNGNKKDNRFENLELFSKADLNKKHGQTREKRTTTYVTWVSMRGRCTYPGDKDYHNYGSRGIKICDRWLESFENFREDMGERPKGTTLDRINNSGNYCKENCRWSNIKEQNRNRRNNKLIQFNGETKCLSEWAEIFGLSSDVLGSRLLSNWPIDKALTTKLQTQFSHNTNKLNCNIVKKILQQLKLQIHPKLIAKKYNISTTTIYDIIAKRTWKHIPR